MSNHDIPDHLVAPRSVFLALLLFMPVVAPSSATQIAVLKPSVFDMPQLQARHGQLQAQLQQLFRVKDYQRGAAVCRQAIKLFPTEPLSYYNLACCLSMTGDGDGAIDELKKAVARGFNKVKLMQDDSDLGAIRKRPEFAKLLVKAAAARPQPNPLLNLKAKPALVADGAATVSEENSSWDPRIAAFVTKFDFADNGEGDKSPLTTRRDAVGRQLTNWYIAGTAAGLNKHLYDNHDNDHSRLRTKKYPQLARIVFDAAAKARGLHNGAQNRFFYNAITIGNSSTALTGKSFWRSQPRYLESSQRGATFLYLQYVRNQIYVYPEHRDHDHGEKGKGDVFFANTPYLIASQGSSGSDRKFLNAIVATLSAFRPQVKKKLAGQGALMATLQMIFRRSNKPIKTDADYLTGQAHPSAFEGSNIDEMAMIKMAHDIKPDNLPPLVRMRVDKEDEAVLGVDYFENRPLEKWFTTPSSICRIVRSTKYSRRIVVSAETSVDLNDRPLTWHWKVLRGDARTITIKPLNKSNSTVEITVAYPRRRAVHEGSELLSNRVDIGCFVHNGVYYSAPAFLTFYAVNNEIRKYNRHQQIESVEYLISKDRYADPYLTTPRQWKDEYRYDDQQRLIGWTRKRGKEQEEFTADGALIVKKDALGRALKAITVRYIGQRGSQGQRGPTLVQQPGAEILHYEYASKTDQRGRVTKRERR